MVPYPTRGHPHLNSLLVFMGPTSQSVGPRLLWPFLKDITQERRFPMVFLSLRGCLLLLCPSGLHPGKAGGPLIALLKFKVTWEDRAGHGWIGGLVGQLLAGEQCKCISAGVRMDEEGTEAGLEDWRPRPLPHLVSTPFTEREMWWGRLCPSWKMCFCFQTPLTGP